MYFIRYYAYDSFVRAKVRSRYIMPMVQGLPFGNKASFTSASHHMNTVSKKRKMAVELAKKALILITLAAYIGLQVLTAYSNIKSPLFPRSISNISAEFPTEITPSSSTFAIWGVIYAIQTVWIIYSLTLLCRKDAADILPAIFYMFFIVSCICNVLWIITWVREKFVLSLGLLFGITVSLAGSVATASIGLYKYLKNVKVPVEADVLCIRILIQNGIIFYTAWVTIATCINLVVTLTYKFGLVSSNAATIGLSVLSAVIVCWFILENFVCYKYTKFIFAEYIVLIVGLSGVIKAHWTGGGGNQTFVLIILIIALLLLVARIIIIIKQEKKDAKSLDEKNPELSMY